MASPGVKRDEGNPTVDVRSRRNNPVLLDDPEAAWPGHDQSTPLDDQHRTLYQSVGALVNFVALDRPDLLCSIKEVM